MSFYQYRVNREAEVGQAIQELDEQIEWARKHGKIDLVQAYTAGQIHLLNTLRVLQTVPLGE